MKVTESLKISRLAIAQNKKNPKNTTIVKILYYRIIKSNNLKLKDCVIEIQSISGVLNYEVLEVSFREGKVYFLKKNQLYFIEINRSLFNYF